VGGGVVGRRTSRRRLSRSCRRWRFSKWLGCWRNRGGAGQRHRRRRRCFSQPCGVGRGRQVTLARRTLRRGRGRRGCLGGGLTRLRERIQHFDYNEAALAPVAQSRTGDDCEIDLPGTAFNGLDIARLPLRGANHRAAINENGHMVA